MEGTNLANIQLKSPVPHADFIWVAEYVDGKVVSEYDFDTKKYTNFYKIDKTNLLRFGLVGHGSKVYFDSVGGSFHFNGHQIDLVYKDKDKEYNITGHPIYYRDVITYKDAEATARVTLNPKERMTSRVTQYNVGYKIKLNVEGHIFDVKVMLQIPLNKSARMSVFLASNSKLRGNLSIRRNGREVDSIPAPLDPGLGGELLWIIK